MIRRLAAELVGTAVVVVGFWAAGAIATRGDSRDR